MCQGDTGAPEEAQPASGQRKEKIEEGEEGDENNYQRGENEFNH